MTREEYGKMPAREMIGRKVRSKQELRNGWATIAAGTIWTIKSKQAGLGLVSDPCGTCGISVSITKVQPQLVELI